MDTTSVTPKSRQEILDHTIDYFCTQQCATIGPGGTCAYRTTGGEQLLGFWIPPALHRPQWDLGPSGTPVRFLIDHHTERAPFVAALAAGGIDVTDPYVLQVLEVLQDAHNQSRHLRYTDDNGKRRRFDTRPAFFDAYIPHLLQSYYSIPGISYAPRSASVSSPAS